ncbi:dTMP kinase [Kitasatospora sp. NPDC059327]|uniref:dTMP kinase n=1 Tax=Kitasatospora sp. NPDC059327 TaxID=3346803 RepID=UPI0036A75718
MLLALEGVAGAGKSTLRDRLLADAAAGNIPVSHVGQFSWLCAPAARTLIALRAGRPGPGPDDAAEAAWRDLTLHARFVIEPARRAGPVIADRLSLSTAVLLALVHRRPVAEYVHRLAERSGARPDLTILLTTPPEICHARIGARPTARRFTEDPATAARLADLYDEGARAWTAATALPVLRHPSTTESDLDALATTCLDRLREHAPPAPTTGGHHHEASPAAPRRLGP